MHLEYCTDLGDCSNSGCPDYSLLDSQLGKSEEASASTSTCSGVAAMLGLARGAADGQYSGVASVVGVGKAKDPAAGGGDGAA